MGKENLIYRPGRASGERIIETRDAELQKPLDFSFGFTTFAGDFNSAHIANTAKAYNTPVVAREYSEFLNGRLIFSEPEVEGTKEDSYSLFSTENKLVVSAIKKAEDKDGYIDCPAEEDIEITSYIAKKYGCRFEIVSLQYVILGDSFLLQISW